MIDVKTVKRFYHVNKLSVTEIAKKVGVSEKEIEVVIFKEEVPQEEEKEEEVVEEAKKEVKKSQAKSKK